MVDNLIGLRLNIKLLTFILLSVFGPLYIGYNNSDVHCNNYSSLKIRYNKRHLMFIVMFSQEREHRIIYNIDYN